MRCIFGLILRCKRWAPAFCSKGVSVQVDADVRALLGQVSRDPAVASLCFRPGNARFRCSREIAAHGFSSGILSQLKSCSVNMRLVATGLNAYLERHRSAFPQFNFVAPSQLLDVFCDCSHPLLLNQSLYKVFPSLALADVDVLESHYAVVAVHTISNERLELDHPVTLTGEVLDILHHLDEAMRRSVRKQLYSLLEDSQRDHLLSPLRLSSDQQSKPVEGVDDATVSLDADSNPQHATDGDSSSRESDSGSTHQSSLLAPDHSMTWMLDKLSNVVDVALTSRATMEEEELLLNCPPELFTARIDLLKATRALQISAVHEVMSGSHSFGDHAKLNFILQRLIQHQQRLLDYTSVSATSKLLTDHVYLTYVLVESSSAGTLQLEARQGQVAYPYGFSAVPIVPHAELYDGMAIDQLGMLETQQLALTVALVGGRADCGLLTARSLAQKLGLPHYMFACSELVPIQPLLRCIEGAVGVPCLVSLDNAETLPDSMQPLLASCLANVAQAVSQQACAVQVIAGGPSAVLRHTPFICLNYGEQSQARLDSNLRTTARCITLHSSSLLTAVQQIVLGLGLAQQPDLEAELVNALRCARDFLQLDQATLMAATPVILAVVQSLLDDSFDRQPEVIAMFVCEAARTVLEGWCQDASQHQLVEKVVGLCLPRLLAAADGANRVPTASAQSTSVAASVQRRLLAALQQQHTPQRTQCSKAATDLARLLAHHPVVRVTGPLGVGKQDLVNLVLRCLEQDQRAVHAHTLLASGWSDEALLGSALDSTSVPILAALLASRRQRLDPDIAEGMDAEEQAAAEQPVWLILKGRLSLPVQRFLRHFATTGQLTMQDGSRYIVRSSTRIIVLDDAGERPGQPLGATVSLGPIDVVDRGCQLHEAWLVEQQSVSPSWASRYVQATADVWTCLQACTTVASSGPTYMQVVGTLQALFVSAVAAAWQDTSVSPLRLHSAAYMYALMWASLGQLQPGHADSASQSQSLEALLERLAQDLNLELSGHPLLEHIVEVDAGNLVHIGSVLPDNPLSHNLPGEADPLNSTYVPTPRLEALRRASVYSLAGGRHVGLCGSTAAGKTVLLQAVAESVAGFDGTEAQLVRFNCCPRSTASDLWQQLCKPMDVSNGLTYRPTSHGKVLLMLDGLDQLQPERQPDLVSATKYPRYNRSNTATASQVHPPYLHRTSNTTSCLALPAAQAQQLVTEGVVLDAEGLALGRPRRLKGVSLLFSANIHQGRLDNGCALDPRLASLSTLLAVPPPEAEELCLITEQLVKQWVLAEHARKHLNTAAVRTPIPDVAWVATLARCTVTAHHQLLALYLPIQRRLAYRYVD